MPTLSAQEGREFGPDPDKRQRARHGRAYRGRSSATGRQIPEMRAADHVDFAPRPEEPSLMDRALRVARGVREMLVPDTPGEWAFEAATAAFPPAKAAKAAGKLIRKIDMTTPLADIGFRTRPEIQGAYEGPMREMFEPLAGHRPPEGTMPSWRHFAEGEWTPDEPGRVALIPATRRSPSYDPRTGTIHIGKESSPFIIGHEAGHGLDYMGGRLGVPFEPRRMFDADADFARRKQVESIERAYPEDFERVGRQGLEHHAGAPTEERASLLGSYLAFPDSVPLFAEFVERELAERGIDVEPVRQALQYPREALQAVRGRRRRRRR
ncbi:MAG: hypothetical protein OXH68_15195 [Gammaproteobacteria bacterium]|nr:hypothetical protein [Gammaproteobacteria bacterium]